MAVHMAAVTWVAVTRWRLHGVVVTWCGGYVGGVLQWGHEIGGAAAAVGVAGRVAVRQQ